MEDGKFRTYHPPDPLARKAVFDAIEDAQGALWLATPAGLSVVRGKQFQNVVAGGPLLIDFVVTLSEGRDGAIWAGTYGKGLWRVKGNERRQYTTTDGLSSDQIRSLYRGCGRHALDRHLRRRTECPARRQVRPLLGARTAC